LDTHKEGNDYVVAIRVSYKQTIAALDASKPGQGSGKGKNEGKHTTRDAKRWWANRLLILQPKGQEKYCVFRCVDYRKKPGIETSYNFRRVLGVDSKTQVSFRFFGNDAPQASGPTDSKLGPCED
jgi:hypothetical protein